MVRDVWVSRVAVSGVEGVGCLASGVSYSTMGSASNLWLQESELSTVLHCRCQEKPAAKVSIQMLALSARAVCDEPLFDSIDEKMLENERRDCLMERSEEDRANGGLSRDIKLDAEPCVCSGGFPEAVRRCSNSPFVPSSFSFFFSGGLSGLPLRSRRTKGSRATSGGNSWS